MEGSPRFLLGSADVQKIIKGGLIALAGAGVVFMTNISGLDFGAWSPTVGALAAIVINVLRKWIADNTQQ
jgi:hypothetical protein